jgi:hypothetical protein
MPSVSRPRPLEHQRSGLLRGLSASADLPTAEPNGFITRPDSRLEGRPISALASGRRAAWCQPVEARAHGGGAQADDASIASSLQPQRLQGIRAVRPWWSRS